MSDEMTEYFEYVVELEEEMMDLFKKHQELAFEHSTAMRYISDRKWREGYVQWMADRDNVKGKDDGDSLD